MKLKMRTRDSAQPPRRQSAKARDSLERSQRVRLGEGISQQAMATVGTKGNGRRDESGLRAQSREATSLSEPGSVWQVHLAGRLLRWRQSSGAHPGGAGGERVSGAGPGVGGDAGRAEILGKLVRETPGGPAHPGEAVRCSRGGGEVGGGGGRPASLPCATRSPRAEQLRADSLGGARCLGSAARAGRAPERGAVVARE